MKWSNLTKLQRCEAIELHCKNGSTANTVVADLQFAGIIGQTKNAIIGFANRNMPGWKFNRRGNRKSKISAPTLEKIAKKIPKVKKAPDSKFNMNIFDARQGFDCKFPLWDNENRRRTSEEFIVCGTPTKKEGVVYCDYHNKACTN